FGSTTAPSLPGNRFMNSIELPTTTARNRLWENPWPWLAAAAWTALLALGVNAFFDEGSGYLRFALVLLAVVSAGTAVRLRLMHDGPAWIEAFSPLLRSLAVLVLAAVFGGLFLIMLLLLVLAYFGFDLGPWRPGNVTIICLLVAPMSAVATRRLLLRGNRE